MARLRALRLAIVAALLVAGSFPTAAAGVLVSTSRERGTDYTKVSGLSRPVYEHTVRNSFRVPMQDGTRLYVEVVRPDPERYGKGPWPVIMEASPYHGTVADRDGTRIFPDAKDANGRQLGLTGYFAPRGYAIAMVDLRGTGRSEGCLDQLGPNDAADLKRIVEWAAGKRWSSGRVGLTGHSYVGSTPSLAASRAPRGLVTIVPSAGLASMYDHQFQYGVPYFLQWMGPMWAYGEMAIGRDLPPVADDPVLGYPWGENFGENPGQTGCGLENSSLLAGEGQLTGRYQGWHAKRDWRGDATAARIPVFIVHGVNDNAARIPGAEWFFGRRFNRRGDKVWLGQWDHGATGVTACPVAHPNCRFDQWKFALHAWFDKHLKRRDVDTGPAVEVFLNGGKVWRAGSWKRPEKFTSLYADADDRGLGRAASQRSSIGFTSVVTGPTSASGSIRFRSTPLETGSLFVGLPRMKLSVSLTSSQSLNLIATLFRRDRSGLHPMTYCAVQPLLRNGVDQTDPVVPGEKMRLSPQCFTMAHFVPAGRRLVLEIGTSSPHHVSTQANEINATIFTGRRETRIILPKVVDPKVYTDVKPRPAP